MTQLSTVTPPRQVRPLTAFYAVAALIGTVGPWLFFGSWFAGNGFAPGEFVRDLFANGAAGGFSFDVLISIVVFWVWSWTDARQHGVRRWWIVLPLSFLVGLSSALPSYLLLRASDRTSRRSAARTT